MQSDAEFVAECFWPGITDAELRALAERAGASASMLSRAGENVQYVGSLFMRRDEVVLLRFSGSETAVRRVAEHAAIPFARLQEATTITAP